MGTDKSLIDQIASVHRIWLINCVFYPLLVRSLSRPSTTKADNTHNVDDDNMLAPRPQRVQPDLPADVSFCVLCWMDERLL